MAALPDGCKMRTVTRKSMLYPTKVEYGDYAMNHVFGCAHGCRYPCYAYLQKKRFGQVGGMGDWTEPALVENTLEILSMEIPKLKGNIRSVQMCFTTDPFMKGYPEVTDMSLKAARMLNDNGIKCVFLTKGELPADRLGGLSPLNEYGVSLVSLDESFIKKWEPGAATASARLASLEKVRDMGLRTWVSMEPYPTPNMVRQDIVPLLRAVGPVDRIVFGKINYNSEAYAGSPDRWRGFYSNAARLVRQACVFYGAECVIKAGTPAD